MRKSKRENELSPADLERAIRANEIMDSDAFRLLARPAITPEARKAKRGRYRRSVALRQASTLPVVAS